MRTAAETQETGWLADFIYTGGAFESGLAMFVDESGRITRFSRESADLAKAHRLPDRAILPGLVNVHSHAFQRVIRGRTEHRTAAGLVVPVRPLTQTRDGASEL